MNAAMTGMEEEVNALREAIAAKPAAPQAPRRMRLPPELLRTDIHHEPASTTCRCGCGLKRIGEDVSEKLGYHRASLQSSATIRGK